MSARQDPEAVGLYFTDSYRGGGGHMVVFRGENAEAVDAEEVDVPFTEELDDLPKYARGSPGQKGVVGLPVRCEVTGGETFVQEAENIRRLYDGGDKYGDDRELRASVRELRRTLSDVKRVVRRLNRRLDDR